MWLRKSLAEIAELLERTRPEPIGRRIPSGNRVVEIAPPADGHEPNGRLGRNLAGAGGHSAHAAHGLRPAARPPPLGRAAVFNHRSRDVPISGSVTSRASNESEANRGRLRGQLVLTGGVGEAGVPPFVVGGEGVVEDAGADLEQQVGTARGPAHLLFSPCVSTPPG